MAEQKITGRLRLPTKLEEEAFMTAVRKEEPSAVIAWLDPEGRDIDWRLFIESLGDEDKKFVLDCIDVAGDILENEQTQYGLPAK